MLAASGAHALTIKKGQVIGGDGVYDGASPEQMEVYIERAQNGGDTGLVGNNVFVVVGDDITFVSVQDCLAKQRWSAEHDR